MLPVCYRRSHWALAFAAGAIACAAKPIHADEDVLVVQEQAVVAVDAVAAPMPAPAAAAGNADEDARLAPIRAQYEPLLKSELSFANRICGWSDEQRRAAIKEGVAWLTEFARKQIADQNPVRAGMLAFVGLARPRRAAADPATDAEQQIADLIAKQLTDEQKTLYIAEHDKRQAFRKQTVIDNLIAKLDEKLDLTAQQRHKLSATLEARWSEDWAPQLEIFVHMGEYVPQIPDEYVTPHLTAEQKKLWNGLQKVSFGRGVNFGQDLFPGGVDDIDLSDAK